jgi:aryl-alcohol dehydrogenase-like predicted oxidoreductase
MTLNMRRLGTTDLEITTVGFGAWAIGGGGWAYGWGPQDDASSIAAIRHAVDRGVNWVDTAAIYGLGHSEEVVGRAVREIPAAERPFVFTKGGMVPDPARPLERSEAIRHVDSLQPPFSLIRRDAGADVIPWAATHGAGVIVYSPMQSGILTETFSAERLAAMADEDWRRRSEPFLAPQLSRNIALRDALRPIAERHGATVSALAVAWTLARPGVTGAIVGARDAAQVDGWIGAGSLPVTAEDLTEITEALRRTGAGSGPVESVQRVHQ